MSFSPMYFLLQQEGFITRSCITTGLTEIRNAHIGEKGKYYTAFFQLAIGIERMAKLSLILDHMATNNLQPPGENTVRKYSHNIDGLYASAQKIAEREQCAFSTKFELSPIQSRILSFLSEFARSTRYANLDD